MTSINCACRCGSAVVQLSTTACARFRCHCETCQAIYQQPYSDASIVNAKQLKLLDPSQLYFTSSWSMLRRGLCRHCDAPVVAFLPLLPGLSAAIVPAQNYPPEISLPELQAHIFYHRRQQDVDDDRPKVSGFLRSEWTALRLILQGLLAR
ncbi:MAG: GFA family protein [Pseudomonadales bacterium]|nr:GFA family protein [Pseudomonadales bacterium]